MAGSSVKIQLELDDSQIKQAFKRLIDAGIKLEPVFGSLGEALLNSHKARFKAQESPGGDPWQELDAAYQAKKPRNADKILVLEGYMRDLLAYNASAHQLELGTNLIQGATHQFGDDSRHIPERPFLGISHEDEQAVLTIVQDHFTEGFS